MIKIKIIKVSFGYLILLMQEEEGMETIEAEVNRLKKENKVVKLVSGTEDTMSIVAKLLERAT